MVTIKKGEIVDIQIEDEDKPEEKTEKAASPPTMDMAIARIDQLTSLVNELSETVKTLKAAPPTPPKKDEEKEKKPVDEEKKKEKAEEVPIEKVVEKKEEQIDVVAIIKELVKKEVGEKIGEQPIQKRSTAPAEKLSFNTPMDIPASIMANADPESILRLGGYTTKRRNT